MSKYPKYPGQCVICGEEAMLYGQPEENAWRGWCATCHKKYEFICEQRERSDITHVDFLRELMAIRDVEGRDVRNG